MNETAVTDHVRRVGWEADLDDGKDWIRDIDYKGFWDRPGTLYAEKHLDNTAVYALWVYVPLRYVDRRSLIPWWCGPDDLVCDGTTVAIAHWYPGTSAPEHAYNRGARYYARLCDNIGFDACKARGPRILDDIARRLIAGRR